MKRALMLTLILMIAAAAFAAPDRRPGRHGRGQGARIAEFLDLTEAQKSEVAALKSTERATIQPLRQQIRGTREEIEAALAAGNSAKAGELMLANYRLRQQIKTAHETFKTSVYALLTPAQKQKFDTLEELRELRRPRRTPRG